MGNELSRARVLTVSSFLVNFVVQIGGMVSTPNMKDVAEANHFAFSPNPWFIAAFFSGQVVLQLAWIRELFRHDPPAGYGHEQHHSKLLQNDPMLPQAIDKANKRAWKVALRYVPVYALGNFCIAGWLYFWLQENFVASQVLVTINTIAQLAAVAALPPLTPSSPRLLRLTHFVAKTFAGIGVLDLIDNGGVAFQYRAPPTPLLQGLTYTLFPLAAVSSSPLFGSVLLYDIIAVAVGQAGVPGADMWATRLAWTSVATAAAVGLRTIPTITDYRRR